MRNLIWGGIFWKFLGYDLIKDLVGAHKGVIGWREPPRKVTVKILRKEIIFTISMFYKVGRSEITS